MASETVTPDYYAVLQVHPDAEREVIEAVYRRLMKKYHPDLAGDDPERKALHNERARAINQAFTVLRNPETRRFYDQTRLARRTKSSTARTQTPTAPPSTSRVAADSQRRTQPPPSSRPPTPGAEQAEPTFVTVDVEDSTSGSLLHGPLVVLSAAYYLLPGPYEWDASRHQELRSVFLLPPIGVASFALATGRLAPWLGHSPNAMLVAWMILALLSIPTWQSLPRVAVTGVPTFALLSGKLDPIFHLANVPNPLLWGLLCLVSLMLSARLYVFAVLPTLAVCWLITRVA